MLKAVRFFLLTFSIVCISLTYVEATHLRAGDITVTRYSCSGYRFKITLHIYTRASSETKFGGGTLDFGDGTSFSTPVGQYNSPPIISPVDGGIGYIEYPIDHTYAGGQVYTITYKEHNRNKGILNIDGSDNVQFFIQTQIIIDDFIGCDNSPQLLVPPIDMGCTGVAWFHNPGAYDNDGDSLSYKIVTPLQDALYVDKLYVSSIEAPYTNPSSSAYSTTTETGVGSPVFEINAKTGTIKWDCPSKEGEYNIAFEILEWRKVEGIWVNIGYVERDMQVIIQDCKNNRPKIQVPPNVCVTAGDPLDNPVKGIVTATDPAIDPAHRTTGDGTAIKLEAFSQIFSINPSPATYTPDPPSWQTITNDTDQAQLTVTWQTECLHVKEQPYEVVFKATDNGSPNLATFETWTIQVVAPAPNLISAALNPGTRTSQLNWQKYTCANASYMQIWRRVDSAPFTPPKCLTGMPDFLGYELIDKVSIASISYTDKHLAVGAEYCYRLVAVFPDGSNSPVSQEVCIPPILADAPVVTNVTIDVTDTQVGQITVKWRPPFEASTLQFPPPYSYEVYRAEGFSGKVNLVKAFSGQRPDTVWVDTDLNTDQTVYNYRVLCYDKNGAFIDTSAVASSVRLELKPLFKQVQLSWNANVPWSNNIVPSPSDITYTSHFIYRGTNSSSKIISDLVLIDSVNVNQQQFSYLDSGQFNHTPLIQSQEYCYAVMTRGSYGNPKIKVPLINFSEITCTIPDNQTKPCKPVLALKGYDCSNYNSCYVSGFSNTVKWKRPGDSDCRNEIKAYNIYAANSIGDSFTLIASMVTDTFYVHSNLTSYAQCYKVSAVSRAGLEGDLSDQFCFDNCPYYELPNVFTPNGDGCNDVFSAFNITNYLNTEDGFPCGYNYFKPGTNVLDTAKNKTLDSLHLVNLKTRCARFVLGVNFTVYNRWGKEVYNYQYDVNLQQDGGDAKYNPLYINWNGKDNNGRDLDPGVYYYGANVVFAVVDPKKRNQTIKGWVQIFR